MTGCPVPSLSSSPRDNQSGLTETTAAARATDTAEHGAPNAPLLHETDGPCAPNQICEQSPTAHRDSPFPSLSEPFCTIGPNQVALPSGPLTILAF